MATQVAGVMGRISRKVAVISCIMSGSLAAAFFLAGEEQQSSSILSTRDDVTTPDCGAVGLYVICRLQGMNNVSLDELRTLTNTGEHGTSLLQIKEAAEQLGFTVCGAKISSQGLRKEIEQGATAIVHLPIGPMGHFLPLVGVTEDGRFLALDARCGIMRLSGRDIERTWNWKRVVIILRRTDS